MDGNAVAEKEKPLSADDLVCNGIRDKADEDGRFAIAYAITKMAKAGEEIAKQINQASFMQQRNAQEVVQRLGDKLDTFNMNITSVVQAMNRPQTITRL